MTYVRHRDRMVHESVYEALNDTLIACRYVVGTTTREVTSPSDPNAAPAQITTTEDDLLKILRGNPVKLSDYFPTASSGEDQPTVADFAAAHTEPNTLALDDGQAGEPIPVELGSSLVEVPYQFHMMFSADTVAVAQAVLNDLRDRFQGRIVHPEYINLYDYNTDPDTPVVRMEVDVFSYLRAAEEEASAYDATMYYARLEITDTVD